MRQISIKQIVLAGIFLSLLTLLKLLDLVMIKINGYSAVEFYWIVGALSVIVLPWISSLFVLTIAPFLWLAIGQMEVYSPYSVMLDYFVPLMALLVIRFSRNILTSLLLVLLAGLIKYLSHSLSGVLFYDASWEFSLTFNAPFVFITIGISLAIMFMTHSRLRAIAHFSGIYSPSEVVYHLTFIKPTRVKLVRFGYLNNVYKIILNMDEYILRIPKFRHADWENESKVYRELYKDKCWFDNTRGYLIKPFIKGSEVDKWTYEDLIDLNNKILEFHKLEIKDLITHDWNKWNKFNHKISSNAFNKYLLLINKYKDKDLVTSHNDINKKNVIKSKQGIKLIDFEWTRINHKYFDYAQFYVAEDIHISKELTKEKKYKDIILMTIIFSLLWSYSIKFSFKVFKLRKKYIKKLSAFNL